MKELIKKHWKLISYLFFGALTTLVNIAVYGAGLGAVRRLRLLHQPALGV